jgi:hypothetical protein
MARDGRLILGDRALIDRVVGALADKDGALAFEMANDVAAPH